MFKNPITEIEKFMQNVELCLSNILNAIATIAKGNPLDQETKDKVAEINQKMADLTTQLRDNDANDKGQQEAADALQKAFEALADQLAKAPPPVPPTE